VQFGMLGSMPQRANRASKMRVIGLHRVPYPCDPPVLLTREAETRSAKFQLTMNFNKLTINFGEDFIQLL